MNKTLIIRFTLLLFAVNCFAQTSLKGTIYSKDKKQPLPFVNIGVLNKNIATISNEKGYFEIETAASDTLVFSMVGYQTLKVPSQNCGNEVFMEAQNYQLPEVTVMPRKLLSQQLGFHRSKGGGRYIAHERVALFIANPGQTEGIIKAVHYRLDRDSTTIDWQTCKIRVRIYRRDALSGLPAADILTEPLILEIQRQGFRNHIHVDLSEYQLPFPEEGAFVGLDMIGFTDREGKFISFNEAKYNVAITATGEVPECHTYQFNKARWVKKRTFEGRSRSLNNARFGIEVKFPVE